MNDTIGQIFSGLATIFLIVIFISGWMWFRASHRLKKINSEQFNEEYYYLNKKRKLRKIIFLITLIFFIILCIILCSILGVNKWVE